MARLDIPIVLIDESVVDYGFRVLMSGCLLEPFKQNPVLLLQHKRADDWGTAMAGGDLVLPLGKWHDLQINGHQLVGKPEFDDDDELAVKVEGKVKKGYLNAASIWIEPIEVSDDDSLKLPGQSGPTITKWTIREASIVDIPNCRGALAIRNSAGKKLALSGSEQNDEVLSYLNSLLNPSQNMDRKLLAARLGLSENATDAEISQKLAAVLGDAGKITSLDAEIVKLKGDKLSLEEKLSQMEKDAAAEKVASLVDGAITARKLAATERDHWVKLASADYETTKKLIDGMKGFEGVEGKLSGVVTGEGNPELQELLKLSGRDLYMQGKLQRLKELSEPHFKLKYKEYYGVEYKS